jgi:hypothetical protein
MSGVLCLGTAALWVWSVVYYSSLIYIAPLGVRGDTWECGITSPPGRVDIFKSDIPSGSLFLGSFAFPGFGFSLVHETAQTVDWPWLAGFTKRIGSVNGNVRTIGHGFGLAGFYCERTSFIGQFSYDLAVPDWFLMAVFLLLPIWWIRGPALHREGCCTACDYDLRATPGRCPECGMVPPPNKEIASA